MKVSEIMDRIDNRTLALPMFQRGYVWKRPQVKRLMRSIYLGYPVGGLLIWVTDAAKTSIRTSADAPVAGAVNLLLDGQQRVTSLYGIIRGEEPPFFDGDEKAFKDLCFNLETEEFEFYSAAKMALDPRWVNVTEIFDALSLRRKMRGLDNSGAYDEDSIIKYESRADRIANIRNLDIPDQNITAADISTDTAVEIFNEVNSGGKKLTKGDLALARIGAQWPDAREEMWKRLAKWEQAGFKADRDWLLRCVTAVVTGYSEYERLMPASDDPEYERLVPEAVAAIQQDIPQIEAAVDHLLEATRTYLGMDTDKVHNSKQAFPAMVNYLLNNGGDFPDDAAKAQLLHWYISASIWGRFSGPTETVINQDLVALREDNPLKELRQNLVQAQGDRTVAPENFDSNRSTARFYPLLHAMSRVWGARDWGTGRRLADHEPSSDTALELHHIFPKAYLRRNGISVNDANNFGNLAFQTHLTNIGIRDRAPGEATGDGRPPYMPEIAEHQPGALESQWVPNDPELWKVENYQKFLAERRRLLAEAANEFLASLRDGVLPVAASNTVAGDLDADDEAAILDELNRFVTEQGLAAGELGYEPVSTRTGQTIIDPQTGEPYRLDLAWPNGLQDGVSEPVAVLIDEEPPVRIAANEAGIHRIYTEPEPFKRYVLQEILGVDEEEMASVAD